MLTADTYWAGTVLGVLSALLYAIFKTPVQYILLFRSGVLKTRNVLKTRKFRLKTVKSLAHVKQ